METLLETIHSPKDLKNLTLGQLKKLAEEIRNEIIGVVSVNGGHLASSLGAVELAIAVHRALDTPADQVIWDVGHQAYAHKILTGRQDRFPSLRQTNGLSGFLKRYESEYDAFGAGHAGTSLAAALGMARARDLNKDDYNVVAIIGDGSMTCGMVYEALNTTANLNTEFMVILNDNEMSISKNVGALPKMFNRLITGDWYNYAKNGMEGVLNRFQYGELKIGEGLVRMSHRVEESLKGLIVPGLFFEELGFRYVGPIDGNNLEELIPALEKTAAFKGPRILHIATKKGRGYPYAEKNPEAFHSAPPFHIKTGQRKKPSGMSFTKAFGKTLMDLAEKDEKIVAVTAAMPGGTGLSDFSIKYPDRFYDFGIAEGAAVTTAAGMACSGVRPFVAIYSTFLQRGFDMTLHDAALQNLPVIFALDRSGLVGKDGPTHHGTFDLSYLRMIPGMKILAPRSEQELRNLMQTALDINDGPVAIRYPRGGSGLDRIDLESPPESLPLHKAEWLKQGDKVAFLCAGIMANHALEAAETLEKEGISIGVANMRFIKPFDEDLVREAFQKYEIVFSVEDNVAAGGFGSSINEFLAREEIEKHCRIIGLPDQFIEHGAPGDLYEKYGLSASRLAETVRKALST